jgi:hypothetical protein
MGFQGLVRATENVDVFVRATPENIESLRTAFRSVYAGDSMIDDIRTEDQLGEYPSVRHCQRYWRIAPRVTRAACSGFGPSKRQAARRAQATKRAD